MPLLWNQETAHFSLRAGLLGYSGIGAASCMWGGSHHSPYFNSGSTSLNAQVLVNRGDFRQSHQQGASTNGTLSYNISVAILKTVSQIVGRNYGTLVANSSMLRDVQFSVLAYFDPTSVISGAYRPLDN
jgi:hypothetical protein